jgi:Zn-dependent peptidase ImmA (M78 family)
MTKAATVHVPAGTLRWGRARANADIKEAAAKCDHDVAELTAWEVGDADPPLTALRELAAFYELPLAAFLLSKPKEEPKPTVDQRRLAGVDNPTTNRALALALNRAAGLQVLAAELQEALDAAPFAVTATEEVNPEWLAVQERASLGITVAQQLAWEHEYEALREWRAAVERRGAIVMQSSLTGSDVRAFSLRADPPVIVLDRSDWVRARVFSLAHELGHVVIGGSGICIPGAARARGIEEWCNHFADALLIPAEAMNDDPDVKRIRAGEAASEQVVKRVANRYKVSPAVVWYRLMQTKAITPDVFAASWDGWSAWRPAPGDGGGGQTTADMVVRDYGVLFPDMLLRASRKGIVSATDVSQYLGVPSSTLPSIQQEVASRLQR